MQQKGSHKTLFKKVAGWLHLWLGLASGLVIIILGITGCLFAFQKEISEATHNKRYFVQPQQQVLPLSILLTKAQHALGEGQPVNNITVYRQLNRAWEFMAYKTNDTALTYYGCIEFFRSAFINPYTGEITSILDYKYDFFNIIKYLHWSLLLNTRYGQPIVGYSTLIFVILLITGLILWYPKKWNRATRRQSFTIKWKARYKRLNYDLHNVPGFYCMFIALVLALTGMVYSFNWFSCFVYAAASGTTSYPDKKPVYSDSSSKPVSNAIDIMFASVIRQMPGAMRFNITLAEGKQGTVYILGYSDKETYYKYDALQYDQYNGQLLSRNNYSALNRGEKLIQANYDIHVGAIGGIPGKIIAFIVSFIAGSLPVTGFLIWWWKRKPRH
ncbi:MAG TPA: PepSY-associated TM helix domain-containing protein [Chitinophagaceae bacterium]|nr:PepSY-associated TM helix domain-containing protein [Chitinophagaceae bacterium]